MEEIKISNQGAFYAPYRTGVYSVKPDLYPLTTDFGNGAIDGKVFQIDGNYPAFLRNKKNTVAEQKEVHYLTKGLDATLAKAVVFYIGKQLHKEYAGFVQFRSSKMGMVATLGGKKLSYRDDFSPIHASSSGLDDLLFHLQEDAAIVKLHGDSNAVHYLHIASPNAWDPAEKIGKSFDVIHGPVPGMNREASQNIVRAMVYKGPFVRFAWGITSDARLNLHPNQPSGRQFDSEHPKAYVRVERQVTIGFPKHEAALFLIHPYLYDVEELMPLLRQKLASAIESMTPEQLEYKGLSTNKEPLLAWMSGLNQRA